jgi:glycosyltransferase involved in cell wall biosynthesis
MASRVPAVTVLLPVYNDAKRVWSAIDSVLRQTLADFELLVIDDGSTDGTSAVLQGIADRRLRVLRNQVNRGLPDSLNIGLAEAKADYVARMDSDDICLPPRLAVQRAFLDEHPEIDACGSWVETFGTERKEVWEYPTAPEEVRAGLLFRPTIAHPTAMLRKASFAAARMQYDPNFRSSEDHDFWARASKCLVLANVPRVLLRYRLAPLAVDKAGIKEEYADRARTMLLGRLGIEASPEDLALHGMIARCDVALDPNFLPLADAWLQRLEKANAALAVYPPDILRRLLAHRFWRICWQSAGLGPVVWRTFTQSIWQWDAGVSLGTLLRFYWRCRSGRCKSA